MAATSIEDGQALSELTTYNLLLHILQEWSGRQWPLPHAMDSFHNNI